MAQRPFPVEELRLDKNGADPGLTFSATSVPDLFLKCRNTSVLVSNYLLLLSALPSPHQVALPPRPCAG